MEKLTKRDYFTRILAYAHDEDKDFIRHELELLDKKNAKRSDKPTAKQVADVALMEAIHTAMESGKRYTVTEMLGELEPCAGLNAQKVTALVTKMRNNLMVAREVTKGKAYFVKLWREALKGFSSIQWKEGDTMDEKLIQSHMTALKCTREEAIQLILDDKDTDKGIAKPWDLSPEQMKQARKLANAGTRKTSGTVNRTKKENPEKQGIISVIAEALNGYPQVSGVTVTNPERTVDFTGTDGVTYTVTLTAHRAKK